MCLYLRHLNECADYNTVFGLGVFSMARRHALVSLRHAALPAPCCPFFYFYFFFRINTIII